MKVYEKELEYINRQIDKTEISIKNSKNKPNVSKDELNNLTNRYDILNNIKNILNYNIAELTLHIIDVEIDKTFEIMLSNMSTGLYCFTYKHNKLILMKLNKKIRTWRKMSDNIISDMLVQKLRNNLNIKYDNKNYERLCRCSVISSL